MFFRLLQFSLKYKIKNSIELIYLYIFYFASCGVVGLLFQGKSIPYLMAVLWIVMLFTWVLSIGQFWEEDERDGSLDQWRMSGIGLEWVGLAKWLTHMALVVIPVAAIAAGGLRPLGNIAASAGTTMLVLVLGGAQMLAVAMLAAAASVGQQRTSAAAGIVMLPLAIPSMIWGSAALGEGATSEDAIIMLGAYALLSVPLSCLASAACLRAPD